MAEFKLYIVGEKSANPNDWSIWSEHAIVIARDEQEAKEISNRRSEDVTEIPLNRAVCLVSMSEPNWGDDL